MRVEMRRRYCMRGLMIIMATTMHYLWAHQDELRMFKQPLKMAAAPVPTPVIPLGEQVPAAATPQTATQAAQPTMPAPAALPTPQTPAAVPAQPAQPVTVPAVPQTPVSASTLAQPVAQPATPTPAPTPEQLPPAPQPIAPTVPPASQDINTQGLTTAHLQEPSGNWLAKRGWWERAKDLYGKIRSTTDQVFESRMMFFNKRTELDRTLFDPFYIHAGIGRGELQELLNYLMAHMEEQRAKEGVLNEEERAFMSMLAKEKEALEQLRLDIDAISKLDNSVDDALAKLMDQLSIARNYEQKAWEDFKTIADVLNDKKARELYYAMVTYDENINAIKNYIARDLTAYFEQLTKTATEYVNRIKATLQSLKEKDIDFKKKAKELEKRDAETAQQRRERERLEAEEREREEQEAADAQSWTGWLKRGFHAVWETVTGVFGGLYATVRGWFGGQEHQENEEMQRPQQPTPPPPAPPAPRGLSASLATPSSEQNSGKKQP